MKIQTVPVVKNVFDFFREIEQQASTSWIYLHTNVMQLLEKEESFKSSQRINRLEEDGSLITLFCAVFEEENGQFFRIYFKECGRMTDADYYFIFKINTNNTMASAPAEPEEIFFFKQ